MRCEQLGKTHVFIRQGQGSGTGAVVYGPYECQHCGVICQEEELPNVVQASEAIEFGERLKLALCSLMAFDQAAKVRDLVALARKNVL